MVKRIYKDIENGRKQYDTVDEKPSAIESGIELGFNATYEGVVKNIHDNLFILSQHNNSDWWQSFNVDDAIRLRDKLTGMIDILSQMETSTREMTIKEIEEILGYSIKIIKED